MELTGGPGYDVVLTAPARCARSPRCLISLANCGMLIYGAQYPNEYELPFNISKYCYSRR